MSPETIPFDRSGAARPVADAPVDALLARADELARRWAIALIAARPLQGIAAVPLDDLAREAPALCEQLVRALRSDAELTRLLTPRDGRERTTSGAGAEDDGLPGAWSLFTGGAREAVADVEALRHVLWEVTLAELHDASPHQVADLSDRLAFICSALLGALLDRRTPSSAGAPQPPSARADRGSERVTQASQHASPGVRPAILIDERDEAAFASPAREHAGAVREGGAAVRDVAPRSTAPVASFERDRGERPVGQEHDRAAPRARPWDIPLDLERRGEGAAGRSPQAPTPQAPEEPVMRITRGPGAPVDDRA